MMMVKQMKMTSFLTAKLQLRLHLHHRPAEPVRYFRF